MKSIVFLPEAEQEMLEVARYYQSQASGLGIEYLNEVERAVRAIAESPRAWPVVEGQLRRRLIRRFPFGILYRIEPEEIVIIAVAHLRRKPGYWRERIK
jgi:plasmid stabilization system protein ParE